MQKSIPSDYPHQRCGIFVSNVHRNKALRPGWGAIYCPGGAVGLMGESPPSTKIMPLPGHSVQLLGWSFCYKDNAPPEHATGKK